MSNLLIKIVVRSIFLFTSSNRVKEQAQRVLRDYINLAEGLSPENGSRSVLVPPMRGVDEEMRNWSFYMILEHNSIVNSAILATIQQLVRGEQLSGAATINPKSDVMPSISVGEEQVLRFQDSVNNHLKVVRTLGRLRGTKTSPHPIFGDFDAHKWNCMFSFHLKIHYGQARHVVRTVKAAPIN